MKALLAIVAIVGTISTKDVAAARHLTLDGLGPVRIGMTLSEAQRALHAKLDIQYPDDEDTKACTEAQRADGLDPAIWYMVENGKITRITVTSEGASNAPLHSDIVTAKGFGLGADQQDIVRAYGKAIAVSPHPYLGDQGSYLSIDDSKHRRGIIFETDHGKVTSFRAGLYPSVGYIEGCS